MKIEVEIVNLDELTQKFEEFDVFMAGACKCGSGGSLCGTCGGGGDIAPPDNQ